MTQTTRFHIIAIDGPAASGKSTMARNLAQTLGYYEVNSGALYRVFTWYVLQQGVDPRNSEAVLVLLNQTALDVEFRDHRAIFTCQSLHPSPETLHSEAINQAVSTISAIAEVRNRANAVFHALANENNLIVEGRDIGTVVFPETPYKFFLTASPAIREGRRVAQGQVDAIQKRDQLDSTRKVAPLHPAADAITIDTSQLQPDETLTLVLKHLQLAGLVQT